MMGTSSSCHLAEVHRNSLGNVPFFARRRDRRRGVNQVMIGRPNLSASRINRSAFGNLSGCAEPKLRMMFSFVSRPFCCADDHHLWPSVWRSHPQRPCPRKEAVAVQFAKIGERGLEIVEGEGPQGVPGHLHPLPSREVGEDLLRVLASSFSICSISCLKLTASECFPDASEFLPACFPTREWAFKSS